MPYIKKERADDIWIDIRDILNEPTKVYPNPVKTEGELNYLITELCSKFVPSEPRYKDLNAVVGVLECAKLEFYRRAVALYEEEKISDESNVDPYEDF